MSATLMKLQQMVRDHEKESWHAAKDEPGYTRHTLEHLAKLIGKVGNVVEPREHGLEPSTETIKSQVIPDLLYWALGLAEVHEVNLEDAFVVRLEQNKVKVTNRRQGILETPSS